MGICPVHLHTFLFSRGHAKARGRAGALEHHRELFAPEAAPGTKPFAPLLSFQQLRRHGSTSAVLPWLPGARVKLTVQTQVFLSMQTPKCMQTPDSSYGPQRQFSLHSSSAFKEVLLYILQSY